MADHAIDTNVLIVASSSAPEARPDIEIPVSADDAKKVYDWLRTFRRDSKSMLMLDREWCIWSEYKRNLTEQDYGFLVAREKLAGDLVRFQAIIRDAACVAELPQQLEDLIHDRSDRKFVAVVLGDHGKSSIVNASDSDWEEWEGELAKWGVTVVQLVA